jgi:hypothetical protein
MTAFYQLMMAKKQHKSTGSGAVPTKCRQPQLNSKKLY